MLRLSCTKSTFSENLLKQGTAQISGDVITYIFYLVNSSVCCILDQGLENLQHFQNRTSY